MSTWKRFAVGCLGMVVVSGCNELGVKNADSKKGDVGQAAGNGRACADPAAGFSFAERADRCTREKLLSALESFENAQESLKGNGGTNLDRLKSAKSEAQIYQEIQDHCEVKNEDSFITDEGGGVQGHTTYEGSSCPISFEQNLVAYTSQSLSVCIDQKFSIDDEALQARTGFVSVELATKSGKKNALDSFMVGTFVTFAHGETQLRQETQVQPEGENGRMYYSKIEVSFDDCSSTLELEADNWWDDPRVKVDGESIDPATISILF